MPKRASPQKILVINTKYLGDLIVSTPALRALRKSFPAALITLLVRSEYKDVLAGNPNIDEIIAFDFSIKTIKGWGRLKAEYAFVKLLRREKFDTVISLQSGDRYAQWAFLSGAGRRVAPEKQNLSFLLTDKVKVYEDTISYLDYYLKLVLASGALENGRKTEFILDENNRGWLSGFLDNHGIKNEDTVVAIHPGASEPTKIWPLENFINLIDRLLENPGMKIILLLGPAELKLAGCFGNGKKGKIITADTSDSIQKLALLIARSDLFISNDSGARHIAAALDIPSITLFPEDKTSAWKFYEDLGSQHFIKGKRNSGEHEKSFLGSIDPATVYSKAIEILRNENPKS